MKDELIRNVKNDRFAKQTGIQLVKVSEGYPVRKHSTDKKANVHD